MHGNEIERRSDYRLLFESSRDALVVIAPPDWHFSKANPAALELFGVASEEEFCQLSPWQLSPEVQTDGHSSRLLARHWIAQTLRHGAASFEWQHRRMNGKVFPAEVSLTYMRLLEGAVIKATVRDISDRKKVESDLRESEGRYRLLVDQSPYAICVHQDGRVVFANRAALTLFGAKREEDFIGIAVESIVHPDSWEAARVRIGRMLQGEMGLFPVDDRYRRLDGSVFDVEVSAAPIVYQGLPAIQVIALDVSQRKQAETALRRSNRTLRILSEVNSSLIHTADESELLHLMCRAVVEHGGYRMAWVGYVEHDEGRSIRVMAQEGFEEGYLDQARVTWADTDRGRGPSGLAARGGQTQVAQNVALDPRMKPWRVEAIKRGYAASIALPLLDKGECFGVLTLYAVEPDAFDEDEVRMLEQMAGDLTYGILTLRVKLAHREHERRLKVNMLQTVEAIAGIVEMRDPYTSGHQARVAELARAISQRLGLPEEQVQAIYLAGLVHDLGKIRIPAEILVKPGRLNEVEYSLIKMHPQEGYEILKGIDFSWPIAQTVLQHHERLDGSGYPQGLKGEEILLGARILSAADVVEAISSHRPYRPSLGIEAALDEISRLRGVHYDPLVVDACVALFKEQGYVLPG